jgi:hypothetical protein
MNDTPGLEAVNYSDQLGRSLVGKATLKVGDQAVKTKTTYPAQRAREEVKGP